MAAARLGTDAGIMTLGPPLQGDAHDFIEPVQLHTGPWDDRDEYESDAAAAPSLMMAAVMPTDRTARGTGAGTRERLALSTPSIRLSASLWFG